MYKNKCLKICFFFVIALLLQSEPIAAQQLPLFNQNRENLNPAYVPSNFLNYGLRTSAMLRYRNQWTGLEGAPKTIIGTFSHWEDKLNLLYGGSIVHDETGPISLTGIYGKAGYGLRLSSDLLLTVGLKGGLVQYRVKGEELDFLESGDIAEETTVKLFPDFSLGAMLYFKEQYYVGFSVPQIFGLDLEFKDKVGTYNIQRVQHYYGIVGAYYDFGYKDLSRLDFSSEVRYVQNIPFYINANAAYEYRELLWVSGGFSNTREMTVGAGVIKDLGEGFLKIGYNFSYFFQEYGPFYNAVHELGVSYSWGE